MKEKFLVIICCTIAICFVLIFFSCLAIANGSFTLRTEMDEETLDYLIAHDYCFSINNPPYDSNESTKMFAGDCEYLNYTLFI